MCPDSAVRMRYFGSKGSVVEDVYKVATSFVAHGTFCDPFGGLGTVASRFKSGGFEVWTGDMLCAPHLFQVARIELGEVPRFQALKGACSFDSCEQIVQHINDLPPHRGWIASTYSGRRRFFTARNAMRGDAARDQIEAWRKSGLLTHGEHALLCASLIHSLDRVANTAGTYYAHLKSWYRKAMRPFEFRLEQPVRGLHRGHARLLDAAALAKKQPWTILYLDPPYNTRSYAGYYHFPESLATGYRGPVRGAAGIPDRELPRSRFSTASTALSSLADLIEAANWEVLLFHYSDDGLISPGPLRRLLRKFGSVSERTLHATGYSTRSNRSTRHRLYVVTP